MFDDPFANTANSLSSPAAHCFDILPDDASELPSAAKAIYVGSGGDIVLRAVDSDQDVVLQGVGSGAILPIRIRAIRATGTTASALIGLA